MSVLATPALMIEAGKKVDLKVQEESKLQQVPCIFYLTQCVKFCKSLKWMTAFCIKYGLFEYQMIPIG